MHLYEVLMALHSLTRALYDSAVSVSMHLKQGDAVSQGAWDKSWFKAIV